MDRELLWLAQCIRNHLMDWHQVRDRATQGKGKSIHKTGSPTAVLGQASSHQPCHTKPPKSALPYTISFLLCNPEKTADASSV